ncbi:helix-turn-helix domain-containing protein [Pseudomonas sp. DSP3-2-2]|uniref:helix-turn-helix domain-containing protein n=1 Tax=unclassified Pseudomonas TaxID=196821 RepID=UPI003CF3C251
MLKSFKERIAELRKTKSFCQEQAKLEFVGGITRLMNVRGINNAALAERMDTSPAYITKALRGDANFTIDSMVKITHALGGRIHIHVADSEASVRWLEHFNCLTHDQQPPAIASKPREWIDVSNFLVEMRDEAREIYA